MAETYWAVTVDQQRSRRSPDLVPAALEALKAAMPRDAFVRPPTRTAGDEFQMLLASPRSVVTAVQVLLRSGDWRIGIGLGTVEEPLPRHTNEVRGPAFVHARDAVEDARANPVPLRVRSDAPAEDNTAAEGSLWLLAALLAGRTEPGWEVVDLVSSGMTQKRAAERLGISQAAVSQRLSAAGHKIQLAGEIACIRLLEVLESSAAHAASDPSPVSPSWQG